MMVSLVGVGGWLVVGMMWHDRALIFINGIACLNYTNALPYGDMLSGPASHLINAR